MAPTVLTFLVERRGVGGGKLTSFPSEVDKSDKARKFFAGRTPGNGKFGSNFKVELASCWGLIDHSAGLASALTKSFIGNEVQEIKQKAQSYPNRPREIITGVNVSISLVLLGLDEPAKQWINPRDYFSYAHVVALRQTPFRTVRRAPPRRVTYARTMQTNTQYAESDWISPAKGIRFRLTKPLKTISHYCKTLLAPLIFTPASFPHQLRGISDLSIFSEGVTYFSSCSRYRQSDWRYTLGK
ncbi:hypothetical protein H4582DRAFT_2058813 [Lactarius indigo]|nr:hypothetical protein H4582DRAFT_2058813 [Lactarius indigo]